MRPHVLSTIVAVGCLGAQTIAAQQTPRSFVARSADPRILRVAEVRGTYLVRPDRVLVLVTGASLQSATEEPIPVDAILTQLRPVRDSSPPLYLPSQPAMTLIGWEASRQVRSFDDTLAITLRLLEHPTAEYLLVFSLLLDRRLVLAELRVPEFVHLERR